MSAARDASPQSAIVIHDDDDQPMPVPPSQRKDELTAENGDDADLQLAIELSLGKTKSDEISDDAKFQADLDAALAASLNDSEPGNDALSEDTDAFRILDAVADMRSLRAQIEADFQSASFLAKLKEIKHIANLDLVVRFSQMVERAQECKKNGTFIEPIPRQKKRQPRKKNVDAADVTIEEQGRQPSNERCRIMVAYHGTNPKNCESISKVGLIVPGVADGKDCQIVHGCAMGHGIYLTTSVGTALGYTGIIEGPCVFVCLALAEPGTIVQELGNTIVIKRQEYVLPVAVCHVTPSNQLVSAPPLPAYNLPVWPTFPPASVFPLPPPPPAPTKKKRAPRKRKMPPSNDSGAHPPAPKKTKS